MYVKIPVINSKGDFSGKVIKKLSGNRIKLNITAVYTVEQVKKILKSVNKKSKTIISIFSGRYLETPLPNNALIVCFNFTTESIKLCDYISKY